MTDGTEEDWGSLQFAGAFEVERRAPQIARLLQAIGYPEAWVSDESVLRHFCTNEEEERRLLEDVRREYGVSLKPEDLEAPLWVIVDQLERRPRG